MEAARVQRRHTWSGEVRMVQMPSVLDSASSVTEADDGCIEASDDTFYDTVQTVISPDRLSRKDVRSPANPGIDANNNYAVHPDHQAEDVEVTSISSGYIDTALQSLVSLSVDEEHIHDLDGTKLRGDHRLKDASSQVLPVSSGEPFPHLHLSFEDLADTDIWSNNSDGGIPIQSLRVEELGANGEHNRRMNHVIRYTDQETEVTKPEYENRCPKTEHIHYEVDTHADVGDTSMASGVFRTQPYHDVTAQDDGDGEGHGGLPSQEALGNEASNAASAVTARDDGNGEGQSELSSQEALGDAASNAASAITEHPEEGIAEHAGDFQSCGVEPSSAVIVRSGSKDCAPPYAQPQPHGEVALPQRNSQEQPAHVHLEVEVEVHGRIVWILWILILIMMGRLWSCS